MAGTKRSEIRPGDTVDVVLKNDQATGRLTRGVVKEILTGSQFHPHGIKVRLADGKVGRVKAILPKTTPPAKDAKPKP
ncbi:MAG: YwbE family protein [Candidatus Bathyarchaeota archaeon]|nr:YwbE family protein [Candidatus Bathyarchaeota archaeon]